MKKNTIKVFGIIALVAVIGFSMAACGDIFGTDVPVSGVELNKSSISLTVGGTETLTATVSPSDATNKAVGWSSSNPNVATVTYGTVTAVTAGSAIITVTTADGGKTAQCTVTVTGSTTPITPTYSLNGVWDNGSGSIRITVSGSTGVFSSFENITDAVIQSGISKGYYALNGQAWRNLTSTGNLTWSGQNLTLKYNQSNNVATGADWLNATFTMSADGQTLTISIVNPTGSNFTQTWTRSTFSLNGVWDNGSGSIRITVSGSTGVFSSFENITDAVIQSGISKGYYALNGQAWRNLTSTGNLTWSGQYLTLKYNQSNVATGADWLNATFTISADGQTLTISIVNPTGSNFTQTWTRKQ